MAIVRENVPARIQPVEPSKSRADPETAIPILVERHGGIVAHAIRVSAFMPVRCKVVAIIPVQTVGSSQPQETVAILHNVADPALKRFSIDGEPGEADVFLVDDWQLPEAID